MKELPKVPFYFKTIFDKEVSKVVGYGDEDSAVYYVDADNIYCHRTMNEFIDCLESKTWTICDKCGNEIKEKKEDTEEYSLLVKEYGKRAVEAMEKAFYFATLPPLDEAMGDWKDECFRMLEDDTRKPSLYTQKLGNYFDYKEKKMDQNIVECKFDTSNIIDVLNKLKVEIKNGIKEKKMKYITRDKDYTGCPEEIAELLKKGKEIEGRAGDNDKSYTTRGFLIQYRTSNKSYPYKLDINGVIYNFKYFTPILAKQSTTCVRTLIENGVEIAVDTKVVCSNSNNRSVKRYFALYHEGAVFAWDNGADSFTAKGDTYSSIWDNMHLLEPREYTPKGE